MALPEAGKATYLVRLSLYPPSHPTEGFAPVLLPRVVITAVLMFGSGISTAEIIEGPVDIERWGLNPIEIDPSTPNPDGRQIEWYVVQSGDHLTAKNIESGHFLSLAEHEELHPVSDLRFAPVVNRTATHRLPFDTAFDAHSLLTHVQHLGYRLQEDGKDVLGWYAYDLRPLQVIGSSPLSIYLVINGASAAAINEGGIIVGTMQAIPEPTGAAVLTCLLLTDLTRRRH